MSSYYRQQLEEWLSQLDVKADSVLDVGGSQLPVKDRVKSWDVKEYKIMDLEQPHKVKQHPDFIFDVNARDRDFPSEFGEYSIVFCLEIMEYVWDTLIVCMNIEKWLKLGGILYITFPTVYPVHEPRDQDYLRYTKTGAIKLLEEAGFKILEIIPRTTKASSLRAFYAAEGMRAAKGYDGHEDVGYIIKAQKG